MTEQTFKDDLGVDRSGNYLEGKKVALCVSGGIAAIEAPKLARALRRVGATVHAYMTPEASKFVGIAAMEWGTEQPVIERLSGLAEHICREDAVVVYPATLNTIDKIAAGMADNPVTTLIASALGMKKPVLVAPTMHDSLWNNPFFQNKGGLLTKYGVSFIPPRSSEGKKKAPHTSTVVAYVSRSLSNDPLVGKRVLYTAGPTPVCIDSVRRITNIFRGTLGISLATDAYMRGADVRLLYGSGGATPSAFVPSTKHRDFDEYVVNVMGRLGGTIGDKSDVPRSYDAGVFSAAVADYRPATFVDGKIPSHGAMRTLEFVETPKVIKMVRDAFPSLPMVTFKLEANLTVDRLLEIARSRISSGYQAVVANRLEDMKDGAHVAYLVTADGETRLDGRAAIVNGVNAYVGTLVR